MSVSGRIIDHDFVSGVISDYCGYESEYGAGSMMCGAHRTLHAGQSPLGDGPVRSTVERQQERIKELESEAAWLRERIRVKGDEIVSLQRGLTSRVRELERKLVIRVDNIEALDEQLERVKAERDMAWDRLALLDDLAREVARRLRALDK